MYEYLKEITDEDFGYDIESWEHYFNQYDLETSDGLKLAFKGQLRKTQERKEKIRQAVEDSDNKKSGD